MEWKEVRLGDVCNIITGFPFPGKKYSKEGIRVVRGDNVTIGNLRWDTEKDKRWNEPFDKTEYYSLQANDIVIGMDGSRVGKNKARIKEEDLPLLLAQRVACVRHNELAEQDYLYYNIFSKKFIDYVNSIHTGSAIPHISQKQIEDYKILLPNLETQRRIASILFSLDRKIELNDKINADLEEMAQAIFKNWFVDFEPFKDGKFVDSELGMIPEGWKVGTLDEIFSLKYGKNLSTSMILEKGDYPVYGANGIIGYYNEYNCDKYSVLVTSRGNGSGDVSRTHHPKSFITNNSFVVEPLEQYKYIELPFINGLFNIIDFKSYCSGSAQPQLTNKAMRNICIISPPMEIVIKYCEMLETLFSHIECVIAENSHLSLLRDTLLPRLMSGELEVPE